MKNLIRECSFWNPMTAVTKDLKSYELDNIIIYSEKGALIETDCGWFHHSNNDLDGVEIKPEIIRKTKIDFTKKENYVIKSPKKSYYDDNKRYTLYLYYKNINYKFDGLTLDGLFLNINYSIFDGYKSYMVIGDRHTKSYDIKYSIDDDIKNLTSYTMENHPEEFENALKSLAKKQKEFQKVKAEENVRTVDDIEKTIRESCREYLKNNQELEA